MQLIKKYSIWIVMALLLVGASVMIYTKLHPKTLPKNLIEGTGRIDGDLINLNTKYPARLKIITVDDGTSVQKGVLIAKLRSAEQQAQKAEIEAQIRAQKKMLEAKKLELEISKKTIPLELKKAESQFLINKSQLKELINNINIQKQLYQQTKKDFSRSHMLYKSNSIELHSYELAKLKLDTQKNKLRALKDKQKEVSLMIELAKVTVSEAKASQKNLEVLKNMLESLKENVIALEASKNGIDAVLDEMVLKSPIDGYVVEKIANIGEVIGAGMPIVTLLDPYSLYLKIFVDTLQNGKIKLGDKAVIFLDANPTHPIPAKVVNIAMKAEFTPKEVSVRSDRIQRVFAVHLKPLEIEPLLKLGIPAIGVISIDGKGLPKSLDELPQL